MRSLRFLWYRFPVSVEFLLGLWDALAACSCSLVVQYISGIRVINVGSGGSIDDVWFVRRLAPWSSSSPLQSVGRLVLLCAEFVRRTERYNWSHQFGSNSIDFRFAGVGYCTGLAPSSDYCRGEKDYMWTFMDTSVLYVLGPNHQSDALHHL